MAPRTSTRGLHALLVCAAVVWAAATSQNATTTRIGNTTSTAAAAACTCAFQDRFYKGKTITKLPRSAALDPSVPWVEECAERCAMKFNCNTWTVDVDGEGVCFLKQNWDSNGPQHETRAGYVGGVSTCRCATTPPPDVSTTSYPWTSSATEPTTSTAAATTPQPQPQAGWGVEGG